MDRHYLHAFSARPFCVAGAIRGDDGPESSKWFCAVCTNDELKFKSTAGKQIPEIFMGEPTDVLSSEWTEGLTTTNEQTGLKANDILTENEELLEIKVK